MHLGVGRIDQRRLIAVTAAAARGADRHQGGMVNRIRMHRIKRIGMTGGAVSALGKGLAGCQADRIVARNRDS